MENTIPFVFSIAILIFSIVVHEVSHGYVALMQGDQTAEREGRLTLNPLKHLELFGSIILPTLSYIMSGFIFGWAKPVPYNPYNLHNQRWGPALVAVAGPISNLTLAIIFGLLIRFLPGLVPVVPGGAWFNFMVIAGLIVLINLVLALFNLIPVPPLDGSKILLAALPDGWREFKNFFEQYGLLLFLLFIFFFSRWLSPLVLTLFQFITGSFPIL